MVDVQETWFDLTEEQERLLHDTIPDPKDPTIDLECPEPSLEQQQPQKLQLHPNPHGRMVYHGQMRWYEINYVDLTEPAKKTKSASPFNQRVYRSSAMLSADTGQASRELSQLYPSDRFRAWFTASVRLSYKLVFQATTDVQLYSSSFV